MENLIFANFTQYESDKNLFSTQNKEECFSIDDILNSPKFPNQFFNDDYDVNTNINERTENIEDPISGGKLFDDHGLDLTIDDNLSSFFPSNNDEFEDTNNNGTRSRSNSQSFNNITYNYDVLSNNKRFTKQSYTEFAAQRKFQNFNHRKLPFIDKNMISNSVDVYGKQNFSNSSVSQSPDTMSSSESITIDNNSNNFHLTNNEYSQFLEQNRNFNFKSNGYNNRLPSLNSMRKMFQNPVPENGVLILTEEEKRTMLMEGFTIPTRLPLTKQEERNLKKVRRKIKNKISAQESRRKKKEYMEALEKKVDFYIQENHELKKQLETQESINRSLLSQMRHIQHQQHQQQQFIMMASNRNNVNNYNSSNTSSPISSTAVATAAVRTKKPISEPYIAPALSNHCSEEIQLTNNNTRKNPTTTCFMLCYICLSLLFYSNSFPGDFMNDKYISNTISSNKMAVFPVITLIPRTVPLVSSMHKVGYRSLRPMNGERKVKKIMKYYLPPDIERLILVNAPNNQTVTGNVSRLMLYKRFTNNSFNYFSYDYGNDNRNVDKGILPLDSYDNVPFTTKRENMLLDNGKDDEDECKQHNRPNYFHWLLQSPVIKVEPTLTTGSYVNEDAFAFSFQSINDSIKKENDNNTDLSVPLITK